MEIFDGYLFSKLDCIGSKSEGPKYFLQYFDYKENVVIKQAHLWEEDPNLHRYLNKKVTIEGKLSYSGIIYEKINEYRPKRETAEENKLQIALKTGTDILWVNKMPGGSQPAQAQCMDLTLLVQWPCRSIWRGQCPTAKIYDFWIEYNGKHIWRWSDGKVFAEVITPVSIPGGSEFHEFAEIWKINPDDIVSEGIYTARALFVASRQEVTKDFEIKFAH